MGTLNKITLVAYLQEWDPTTRVLAVRVLVAPTGNPLAPLTPAAPAFADAHLVFAVCVSDAVDALPQRMLVDETVVQPDPTSALPTFSHPDARAIFTEIKQQLDIPDGTAADTFSAQSRDLGRQLRKYLPRSYRASFPFTGPRTSLAVVDDTYHCLMRCPPDAPAPPLPPTVIGWGEALAFSMRRPRLAEALGLVYALEVPVGPAPRLEHGGWLWVELAPASDFSAQAGTPGFARSFATRVPPLPIAATRPVFTPVVFPISEDATQAGTLGNFDKVFAEAARFDDGFSKIVHARQPLSADPLDEDGTGAPIVRDAGIQMGWDDEDLLEGQNRALGAPPDGEDPVLAPRGVLGYRVDVRTDGAGPWTSLSTVEAPLAIGVDLGTAVEERWSEVFPAEHSGALWLPSWFLNWRGGSLVVATPDEQRLMDVPPGRPVAEVPVGADAVRLRYGRRYELRTRLVDATGGGPALAASTSAGESPTALVHFRRHRRPGTVAVDQVIPRPDGTVPPISVRRPPLGYPEAVFAAGEPARAALLAQIAANDAGPPGDAQPPAIRDPDVAVVRIRMLVRALAFDPAADADGYLPWYETTRAFPADPDAALDLELTWEHAADYQELDVGPQLGAEGTVAGTLTLVTARDVRIELAALGRNDLTYFASQEARVGATEIVDLHAISPVAAEHDALIDLPPSAALRSVFLRPDPIGERAVSASLAVQNDPSPALLERLAGAVDLVAQGSALMGREGERVAFGCAGLTHYAAPDGGSLELTALGELAEQWICVVEAILDRDWTWRGGGSPTLTVARTLTLTAAPGAVPEAGDVGTIELMPSVNVQTVKKPDRTRTRFVFVDAFRPPLGADGRPYELDVSYTLTLACEGGVAVTRMLANHLPIVTRPDQVPRVVAAGLALTPYAHDDEYASTISRTKRLWLEFAEPVADTRDAYFARALTRAPDPMLLPDVEPVADQVPIEDVPLDPELVRVITPGQPQDLAGLSTMQRLEPAADSDRRFLVPLPPNTDPWSPELFAFFTYDIRVGHERGPAADPLWSTAQGRFGEPLLLEGVQHPAPELPCAVTAEPDGAITVRAPFASPYVELRRVVPNPPNTQIWIVLYARVMQADASTWRNIQIDLRRARPGRRHERSVPLALEGQAQWSGAEVRDALAVAGLPDDAPITALAVELLPEPNSGLDDPLGGDLGQVRVLRTSPLAPVERDCCAS